MANVHNNLSELFTGIADAIRSKTGSTDPIVADEFPTAIEAIEAGGSSDEEWIGDGNTHIWISLAEGRTSPMLGVGVKGTVTVDWGDGSEPDTLTGTNTSTAVYTPVHNYARAGDYVITLSGGEIGMLGTQYGSYLLLSTTDVLSNANYQYKASVRKIELGSSVTSVGNYAFQSYYALASVHIPDTVTNIGQYAFGYCHGLTSVNVPNGITSIANYFCNDCHSLTSVTIPDTVTSIGEGAFSDCLVLTSVTIPDTVASIGTSAFSNCRSLQTVNIPNGVKAIKNTAFTGCLSITRVTIPNSVESIGTSAFNSCHSVTYYDFSQHTSVPALASTAAFSAAPSDCIFKIPAALYDEWVAATNWSAIAATNTFVGV